MTLENWRDPARKISTRRHEIREERVGMSDVTEKKKPETLERSRDPGEKSRICQDRTEGDCTSENEREHENEFESLEYEEDAYYSNSTATPSFDDIDELCDDADEIVVHCWRDSNGEIDEIVVDDANLCIETEFVQAEPGKIGTRGFRRKRSVRVIFQDFSKPYLAKISNSQNYKKFLELVKGAAN